MSGYLARRIASALPTLLGITLLAFLLLRVLPARPGSAGREEGMVSAEAMARVRAAAPAAVSPAAGYAVWISGLVHGDLGRSEHDGRPVTTVLGEALPWTLLLNGTALLIIYGLAVPFGLLSAAAPGSRFDRLGGAFLIGVYALPSFAAGLLLQQWVAVRWNLLPLQGPPDIPAGTGWWQAVGTTLAHATLPAVCLALSGWAFVARYARAVFRSALGRQFLTAARARGLSRTRVVAHAALWAAVPFVTLLATILPGLAGGSVVVEQIFSWPGVGRLYLGAIETRDTPVILGLTLLSALLVLAANLIVDLLYAVVDPRIRERLEGEPSGGR